MLFQAWVSVFRARSGVKKHWMFLLDSATIGGMESTGWNRLARKIVFRRVELGMRTAKALAEEAGLTTRVIGDLENARRSNFNAGTKAQLERALQWDQGSIDAIVAGGDPVLADGGTALDDAAEARVFRTRMRGAHDPSRLSVPAFAYEVVDAAGAIDASLFAAEGELRAGNRDRSLGHLRSARAVTAQLIYDAMQVEQRKSDGHVEDAQEPRASSTADHKKTDAADRRGNVHTFTPRNQPDEVDDLPPSLDDPAVAAREELDYLTEGKRLEQADQSDTTRDEPAEPEDNDQSDNTDGPDL